MDAKGYIDTSIPYLRESDSVDFGLSLFEDIRLDYLPVISESKEYLGLVDENSLLNSISKTQIQDIPLRCKDAFVIESDHLYEAFSKIDDFSVDVVPVIDENAKYSGLITSKTLLRSVAKISSAQLSGGIIEFVLGIHDYSMAEIARIVESNGGKVMSSFVFNIDQDIENIRVLLKLNIQDVSGIVSEFKQLNYTISRIYSNHQSFDNSEDNLNHLFHFLDI
jgi:CBS-domain-containing membrane protein